MNEGPYRTPDPPSKVPLSFTERLANVTERLAGNQAAKPLVGVLVILGVVILLILVFELPGLLVLHAISMANGKPLPTGFDVYGMAPLVTAGTALGGYFVFRFLRGFFEMAAEVGGIALRWLQEKLS